MLNLVGISSLSTEQMYEEGNTGFTFDAECRKLFGCPLASSGFGLPAHKYKAYVIKKTFGRSPLLRSVGLQ